MDNTPKLTRVSRLDSVPLEKVEYTPEGFLIDMPIVTSVGIFEYHNPDGSVRRELRLPEHVFRETSLATYEGKPVIITHEAGRVDKGNVADEIVGTILSKGIPDKDDVRAKIIIHDIEGVKKSGMRELSLGYDLVLDETPGEWEGKPYDAIQTEIAINHLAIVREARAGEQARLNIDEKNDLQEGANIMGKQTKSGKNPEEMKKTIAAYEARRKRRLDETEKQAEAADEESAVAGQIKDNEAEGSADKPTVEERVQTVKDRRDRRDAEGGVDDIEEAKTIIAQQDEDIQQLVELVEELQAANDVKAADNSTTGENEDEDVPGDKEEEPMNADSVDSIIAQRLQLGRIGDRLNLDGLETLKPLEAKKRVIKALKPDLRLDGKSPHYINTAFDIAVEEMNTRKDTNYQRKQMFNGDSRSFAQQGKSKSQQAKDNMLTRMQKGGK